MTDQQNCCARLATLQQIVADFLQGEFDAGRITLKHRALKGNSLPAPAVEDVVERAREVADEVGDRPGGPYALIDALAAANLLQSTTPPAPSPVQVPDVVTEVWNIARAALSDSGEK